ncbi:MAG: L-threonylcarbamoyladenylate synthase [Nitrospiraceae bacterium]|nr:L-threonylcarbamoyladenylate synthase [Nitrospiraceae bacterium]
MRLIDASVDNLEMAVNEAVETLRKGGIVACPTETYYGLCARYDDEAALERLFALKGSRRQAKPSPLIIGSEDALPLLVPERGNLFEKLSRRFWPGPLTLVVRALPNLSSRVEKEGKVALRMPGASFALVLAKAIGLPLTATSANPSGLKPARSAAQVAEYFKEGVDLIIDAGEAPGGPPSTIVDSTGDAPVLLRQGAIRFEEIEKYLSGPV